LGIGMTTCMTFLQGKLIASTQHDDAAGVGVCGLSQLLPTCMPLHLLSHHPPPPPPCPPAGSPDRSRESRACSSSSQQAQQASPGHRGRFCIGESEGLYPGAVSIPGGGAGAWAGAVGGATAVP
jgi:hypothetical protein